MNCVREDREISSGLRGAGFEVEKKGEWKHTATREFLDKVLADNLESDVKRGVEFWVGSPLYTFGSTCTALPWDGIIVEAVVLEALWVDC